VADIARLQPFIGTWRLEASLGPPGITGTAVFEWELGGAYVIQRSEVPVPQAPDGLCLISANPDGDGFVQHYFDSRGVTRVYQMTFDGTTWTLLREQPDFSPLDFKQRYVGTFGDDRIDGRWESDSGGGYQLDFELNYVRAGS
jgi:hypothetical protein